MTPLQQAFVTAFILETNAASSYFTSRGSVDRTRLRTDSHFFRCARRAEELVKLTLEEQDDLIRAAHVDRQAYLTRLSQPSEAKAAASANTANLLALLKGTLHE